MILVQVESGFTEVEVSREADECCIRKGDFVAVLQPHDDRYSFSVRDLRRQRPTIHGSEVDFPHAVASVDRLLNLLTDEISNSTDYACYSLTHHRE